MTEGTLGGVEEARLEGEGDSERKDLLKVMCIWKYAKIIPL